MKREVKFLLSKAIDSLILSIELFNRPHDRGRIHGVLIFLDHSFEMLLKASILHKGGKIREPRENQTIGFDTCVRRALSSESLQFLTDEQALTLQIINGHRDAAQHHLLAMSEQHLYLQTQASLTLFRDLYKEVFGAELHTHLPERVLPLSTSPPRELASFFKTEVEEIRQLLKPGTRRGVEATARLRALEIMEASIQGERGQPSHSQLRKTAKNVRDGKDWEQIWPGVASLNLTAYGHGPSIDLRFTKKEGIAVHPVPEGTPGASVVAIKRVDELSYYNLSRDQLAEKVGLTGPKTTAVIRFLDLKSDPECFKQVVVGKSRFDRYSQKAIPKIKQCLASISVDDIWKTHGIGPRKST